MLGLALTGTVHEINLVFELDIDFQSFFPKFFLLSTPSFYSILTCYLHPHLLQYKTLEAMVNEVKTDLSYSTSSALTLDKTERISTRTRGSSSPFRCISNLVQQMNLEKDQELSVARIRIEELKALAASRQKEVK